MSEPVPQFTMAADLVQAANEVREHVVRALTRYLELSARMREFEDVFSTLVLHSGQQLQEIRQSRRRLEAERDRIRTNIERGLYGSAEDVEDDVRAALARHQAAEEEISAKAGGSGLEDDFSEAGGGTDLDSATRERIIRDFRRFVLPAVHADTSDSSFSAFETAHSAYKAKDYVIMEALVIRYRGELTTIDRDGRAVSDREARAWLMDYEAAARRLDERLRAISGQATDSELSSPEEARQRMAERHERIRRAIDEETERMQEVRRDLDSLLSQARDNTGGQ